jgi:hypothetical protein
MRSLEIVFTKLNPVDQLTNLGAKLYDRADRTGRRLGDVMSVEILIEPTGMLFATLEHLNGEREVCEVFSMSTIAA